MMSDAISLISTVRSQHPLVHNITNYVVMNITANALLAVGASPVMAHALEEMEEMASLASALVINLGTLSMPWIEAMKTAKQVASQRGIPIILDPVGAGATQLRTRTARELVEDCSSLIIRGNASEICALANEAVKTRGVDSTLTSDHAVEAATLLAGQHTAIVVISGETDHVVSPERHVEVHNGDRIMAQVTGMGCVSTALLGAFAAVTSDRFDAAVATMVAMGVAGELAVGRSEGPGTFVPHFIDALARLSPDLLTAHARIVSR
ncbi:hydroxyethylthiazole kinase [Vacuolonema iberomarrocanum]|uniref:hydroxyethylthiazole kinase n=1 Tax=Vacuolonema iberomarrocanum TaxID=3454632 RepID=UPI003F6E2045